MASPEEIREKIEKLKEHQAECNRLINEILLDAWEAGVKKAMPAESEGYEEMMESEESEDDNQNDSSQGVSSYASE